METLNVFLNNELVGHLNRARAGAKFQYEDGLSINTPILSTSTIRFCQACGLNTSLKYANPREAKGTDPTYKKFVDLLFAYFVDPLEQIQILAKQMVVNLCLGNYDAHAKNYSILYDKNSNIYMSPMYDVVPIAEVEPRTKYLSIRINGKINPQDITYKDLVQEINSWGLPAQDAKIIINECFDKISDGLKAGTKIYPKASRKHKKPTEYRLKQYIKY